MSHSCASLAAIELAVTFFKLLDEFVQRNAELSSLDEEFVDLGRDQLAPLGRAETFGQFGDKSPGGTPFFYQFFVLETYGTVPWNI